MALFEMRPVRMTPAHHTGQCAEPVCSNSFKSNLLSTASGCSAERDAQLGSLIIAAADRHAVPAGGALAVDRDAFNAAVTHRSMNTRESTSSTPR